MGTYFQVRNRWAFFLKAKP